MAVSHLTDKHLMAEYREITRPFSKVEKWATLGAIPPIPMDYCLGQGHETFFFDKLLYLRNRYEDLYAELISRGFNLDSSLFAACHADMAKYEGSVFWNDWTPRPEDLYLNMARLCKRSNIPSVDYELTTGW